MARVLDNETSKMNFVSDEEAMNYFELVVNERLGITVDEFFKRYESGEYKNCGIPGITGILALVPIVQNCKTK